LRAATTFSHDSANQQLSGIISACRCLADVGKPVGCEALLCCRQEAQAPCPAVAKRTDPEVALVLCDHWGAPTTGQRLAKLAVRLREVEFLKEGEMVMSERQAKMAPEKL
jgi:hypothetical protein